MTLLLILGVASAAAGLTMGLLTWAAGWQRTRPYLISADAHRNADNRALIQSVMVNSVASSVIVFGVPLALRHVLFYDKPITLGQMALEGVTVILIYDFAYYFMHRYLFHEWRILRGVHIVHHAALNPRAIDSFLLHPVENALGLLLLLASVAAVGGIHVLTFAPVFTGYTMLNVLNHAGINIPRFPFKTIGRLAVAHDKHHHSMRSGNYASITPLPDIIFGTFE